MTTWNIEALKEKVCFPVALPQGRFYLCPLCGGDHDDGPWWLYPSFRLPICYGCADDLLNRTPMIKDASLIFELEPAQIMVIVGDERVAGEDPDELDYAETVARFGVEASA
ncbi:MAG: hypothetical protein NTZ05_18325 [Chloroflexi bacterium]|nr:hypothetical protein [Chloroflexota bacterium]